MASQNISESFAKLHATQLPSLEELNIDSDLSSAPKPANLYFQWARRESNIQFIANSPEIMSFSVDCTLQWNQFEQNHTIRRHFEDLAKGAARLHKQLSRRLQRVGPEIMAEGTENQAQPLTPLQSAERVSRDAKERGRARQDDSVALGSAFSAGPSRSMENRDQPSSPFTRLGDYSYSGDLFLQYYTHQKINYLMSEIEKTATPEGMQCVLNIVNSCSW